MSYFTGEILQPPALRFDYSSASAQHPNPRQGLRTYGPYDSSILAKDKITCAVIYPRNLQPLGNILINGMTSGSGQFSGFHRLFRVPLNMVGEKVMQQETEQELRRAVQSLAGDSPDLVFFITSKRNETLYATAKAELLGNGIPNQIVTAEKLQNPSQLQWTLENIALACYAKVGGTPWVVASESPKRELVIGVSRAQDRTKKFVVGFVTLFKQDADFLFWYSLAPRPIEWEQDEYVGSLASLIIEAYNEYRRQQGEPESITLHLCKRPGRFREVEAIGRAIKEIGTNIPYALLHLNDDSNYRLFDVANATYVPQAGLKVELSRRNALLLLDGRIGDRRNRRGVPRVLDVSLDRRSTIDVSEFPRLVRQIHDFARVNWRGFNAQAVPVTLNYSYLIARLVVEIGSDRWNDIASAGRLRDKAWFL
jgi:hypothetical protein